jgi:Right handed beta helix region
VAVWPQSDLTLVGTGRGALIMTRGEVAEDKAIWVITGDRVLVDNVELVGGRSSSYNGAGIRYEGKSITLIHCRIHDNEMGILTSNDPDSEVRIEGSEIYRNTVDYQRYGRLGHNIYIGRARRFSLRDSWVHSAVTGHEVKSRARDNMILYNRITDESGRASYLIDLSNGGQALIMGNLLHKSLAAENRAAISFAAEANQRMPGQTLYVVYNTLVTDRPHTVLVNNHSSGYVLVANNLVQGDATALSGGGLAYSNLILPQVGLRDPDHYDYHLLPGSLAIGAARPDLTTAEGRGLLPSFQYLHPLGSEPRRAIHRPDIGAYELGSAVHH